MKRWIFGILIAAGLLLALPPLVALLRDRRPTNDRIRRFNRDTLNPWMVKRAGKGDWYASAIETVGRKTGKTRLTPVLVDPVEGGFVIPLPYGTDVDWLRNARSVGHATIKHHDVEYPVDEFEILDAEEALPLLPIAHRMSFRINQVERFLRAGRTPTTREPVGV